MITDINATNKDMTDVAIEMISVKSMALINWGQPFIISGLSFT